MQHNLVAAMEFVRSGKMTIEKLVEKACHHPAILFQVKDRGFIREGYYADLVIVAGEACDPGIVGLHYEQAPHAALYNEYGPTEMSVWSSWQYLPADTALPIAIGRPLSQTQAMIIDAHGNLLPDGLTGVEELPGAGVVCPIGSVSST